MTVGFGPQPTDNAGFSCPDLANMGYSEPAIWDAAMQPWLLIVVEVLIHPHMVQLKSFGASFVTLNHSCGPA